MGENLSDTTWILTMDVRPGRASISISIVSYGDDVVRLRDTVSQLKVAADALRVAGSSALKLTLVDNGPYNRSRTEILECLVSHWGADAEIITGHGNLGYGRGHNLAITRCCCDYHLVLNPDVELAPDALIHSLAFMEAHDECGLLAPAVQGTDGDLQYLCRRMPTVLDLLIRGFAPRWLRDRFRARLDWYEMRDVINDHEVAWDPPVVSGCYMLFRAKVLKALGGFDPRYFLYFEDFDLSLRTTGISRIAYVPAVRIVHHGGDAARKGPRHVQMFVVSLAKFFRTHGWHWA